MKWRLIYFFAILFLLIPSSFLLCTEVIQSDINNDGNTDGWSYVNGGDIERQEIDMNFDGKVDSVFIYEKDGKVKEEMLDTNYDGNMDNWREYSNGEVTVDRIDSNYDGKADIWFYIDRGRIYKIEKDTNADGQPDEVNTY
jgi:hypothetical protein